MKNLKTYKMFENSQELTPEQIEWLDECTDGTWTLNPRTGMVDVDGRFNCSGQGLTDFKDVRFGVVEESFTCARNQLTSLEGAPHKVSVSFDCSDNQLTSLEGAPQKIGHSFYCHNNQLTSLEGAPREVGGGFYCGDNQLTTLEGAPQKVNEHFYCYDNQLTTLEGAPQKVGGGFFCSDNQLTSLVGAPQKVGAGFYCEKNQLTSLEGAPREIGRDFDCEGNPVSEETLKSIFSLMEKRKSYLQAVESLWNEIPLEDQALLYRPEFEWVSPEEERKLEALKAYVGFKGMI
jgi:hypothetical protein